MFKRSHNFQALYSRNVLHNRLTDWDFCLFRAGRLAARQDEGKEIMKLENTGESIINISVNLRTTVNSLWSGL